MRLTLTRMSEPEVWRATREAEKMGLSKLAPDDGIGEGEVAAAAAAEGKSDYSGAAAHRLNSMRVSTV